MSIFSGYSHLLYASERDFLPIHFRNPRLQTELERAGINTIQYLCSLAIRWVFLSDGRLILLIFLVLQESEVHDLAVHDRLVRVLVDEVEERTAWRPTHTTRRTTHDEETYSS